MGYQSSRSTPPWRSAARKSPACSGVMLMTKRLGASAGVALRQLSTRSVRSSTSSTSAIRPTARLLTCTTAYTGRAVICRVASTSQRGAVASLTLRRSSQVAPQASSANSATAPAKPPTAISPSVRSRLVASSRAAKPSTPSASTASGAVLSAPTSRRITRSGGTWASCSTGGRPKAASRVSPMPSPNTTGQALGAGNPASTSPASSHTKTWCTAKPSTTPSTLAARPTSRNSTE